MMVTPDSRSLRTSAHMSRRSPTSTPAVGSSRKSISGSCASAYAISTRRFLPPERVLILSARLGPNSAKISPSWISRSIPLSACKPDSYVLISWEIAMMGGMAESLPSSRGTMNSPGRDDEVINIGDSVAVAESSGDRVVLVPPTLGTIQAMTIVEDCWQQPIFNVGHELFVY